MPSIVNRVVSVKMFIDEETYFWLINFDMQEAELKL